MKKPLKNGLEGGEEVDRTYVDYLCSLVKLEFDEKEYDGIIEKLKSYCGYAEKLAKIDTDNIEPLVNVNGTINVTREDIIKPSLDRDVVLYNASEKMYGCIKVNKIIE